MKCLMCGGELRTGKKFCSIDCKAKSQKGQKAWNIGLTKETDIRVKQYSENGSKTILTQYANGRVNHNKGKSKETYEPLMRTSKKNSVLTRLQYERVGREEWIRARKNFTRKGIKNSECQKEAARKSLVDMRKNGKIKRKDTGIEIIFENILKTLGVKYIAQYTVDGLSTIDFYIPEKKIIFYVDGCHWHGCKLHCQCEDRKMKYEKDRELDVKLENLGYKVVRFWEHEINKSLEQVKNKVSKLMI